MGEPKRKKIISSKFQKFETAKTSEREGQKGDLKNKELRDFPGGLVVKNSPSGAGGQGSFPGWGGKIPHASQPKNQSINDRSNIVTNSIKDFENGPHQKILKKKKNLM